MTPSPPGRLVLVATPIGNLEDLSPRAARTLAEADLVACEDTRRTATLLRHLGIAPPTTSFHEHNEERRGPQLLDRVASGEVIVVVTDAGTPTISDPGYRLVAAAHDRGLPVDAIPGPAALLQALVLSGLPTDRFAFEGFLPRKAGARRRRLDTLAAEERTLVLYVAPHRAAAELADLAAAFGPDRPAALTRELTKLHQEVRRATLGELAAGAAAEQPRGEVTVVIAGASPDRPVPDRRTLAELVAAEVAKGASRRDAVNMIARRTGAPRNVVYAAAVEEDSR